MSDDWMPITPTTPALETAIVADSSNMRFAQWRHGPEYECCGSIGGGWTDVDTGRGLHFLPTHYQPLPDLPTDTTVVYYGGPRGGDMAR